jgi:crotonobetainyl-CoA:carnitine CoA-transferase CaiB-like acyl-CoA transferase
MGGALMAQPLEGVRVLDFTQVEMGPVCTQVLGDFGADVIKVERMDAGDLSRYKTFPVEGENPIFLSLNRNKRGLAIDLKHPHGQAIVLDLVDEMDVLVHNFRPEVMRRLGLDYQALHERNPCLIYASGSGFGPTGPYQHKGGQDILAQAMSGMMMTNAAKGGPPHKVNNPIGDFTAGMILVQGILLALLARAKTGQGQEVTSCLLDGMIASQLQEATFWLNTGRMINWGYLPMGNPFPTADGYIAVVGAFRPNPLRDLCQVLGVDDLSADPRFATDAARLEHGEALKELLAEAFRAKTSAEWLEELEAADILCSPINTLKEALLDPQVAHNGMIIELEHPHGRVRTIGSPVKLSETPASVRHAPPLLGQQNDEILAELGYSPERIARLRADRVVL